MNPIYYNLSQFLKAFHFVNGRFTALQFLKKKSEWKVSVYMKQSQQQRNLIKERNSFGYAQNGSNYNETLHQIYNL